METPGWIGATPARAEAGHNIGRLGRSDGRPAYGDVTARCCAAAYRAVDADGYVVYVVKTLGPEAA